MAVCEFALSIKMRVDKLNNLFKRIDLGKGCLRGMI